MLAFDHDYKVLVEEAVNAREIESAVMGNEAPLCAEILGEILPAAEFYDFDAKYNDNTTKLQIPADLPAEITGLFLQPGQVELRRLSIEVPAVSSDQE